MIIAQGEIYGADFRFIKRDVRILEGKFQELSDPGAFLSPMPGEEVVDATGLKVIPGLTDVHFHGIGGYDFSDGTPEAIQAIARLAHRVGVLNICPATMTLGKDRLLAICENAAAYAAKQRAHRASGEAELIGLHLEGPFISPERVGAQDPAHVRRPDVSFLEEMLASSGNLMRLATIAPETEGAIDCIQQLHDRIHFSIGHTMADVDTAMAAFQAGADHITHLYNAMPPLTHRAPGPIAAGVESAGVFAEIICDGVHSHPAAVRMAFRLFGADRMVLISDSMRACGMPDGDYELGGLPVIKRGREARQPDGTLAGSVTHLYDCMVEAIRMGIPPEDAVRCAAVNPPASIGLGDSCGLIAPGRKAKALLVDSDWKLVRVIDGEI